MAAMPKLDAELATWLANADDEVLECRGQTHDFEKIRRKTRRPFQNTRVEHRVGGDQIEWTCPNCGTMRIRTVEPDGTLFPPVYYVYRYKANYRGPAGITRRMCFEETQRRIDEDEKLMAARREQQAAATAPAS